MNETPISVVILTANEADNIQRAIKSVVWANEVILIDNSSDNTAELAKNIISDDRLQVVNNNETENFSNLRNLGLTLAKNEWVLYLDADEEITIQLKEEIKTAINEKNYNGFFIKRQDYFLGKILKYGETGNQYLLKLGKKNSGNWIRRVHEVWQLKGEIGKLNNPLMHYPHPTIAEFLERINRWTTLNAQEFNKQNIKSDFFKIFLYPLGKFILNYFIKLGFLDGMSGLIMALMMSMHSFLTRAKLYQLQNKRPL